jgi:hypothetical protein
MKKVPDTFSRSGFAALKRTTKKVPDTFSPPKKVPDTFSPHSPQSKVNLRADKITAVPFVPDTFSRSFIDPIRICKLDSLRPNGSCRSD